MAETNEAVFSMSPEFATDVIMMENTVDLDSGIRDDRAQYLGIMYSLGLDFRTKERGPEFYLQFRRYGPYNYDCPVLINNTLQTFTGKVHPYTNAEYLPEIGSVWCDMPIPGIPINLKGGLYTYSVGHQIALMGSFENYGIMVYTETEDKRFRCRGYFCWPDVANSMSLGPKIKQEKEQGMAWNKGKTYFWALDMLVSFSESNTIQPYVGCLIDRSNERLNLFSTPTNDDLLGTVGCSLDLVFFDRLSVSFEAAKNFGGAQSCDPSFDDVIHRGYIFYADAEYEMKLSSPHTRFIFSSGNKLTTDMINNGDTTYPGTKNNAFSTISPFNANLIDSVYHNIPTLPLVAMGNGVGINYGVRRPETFNDPVELDNLILVNAGFSGDLSKNASFTFDWWYLSNVEKGIGVYNGVPKVLSPDLGHEFDMIFTYSVTKNITFDIYSGIFFPGAAYREERTDTGGSLFTPFVRGDGKADPAYEAEISITVSY
ncbi:MAG TPA: alginate export family protein [Candidatus Omnitrophota bacterium]|nr:alginate export family protein [Candidatus Omnitrophota bacterium]